MSSSCGGRVCRAPLRVLMMRVKRDQAAGGPTLMLSGVRPSTVTVMASPGTTAPTPAGGAGVDQVAGLDLPQTRQVGDDVRHRPDQVGQVRRLLDLAVDGQFDLAVFGIKTFARLVDQAQRRRLLDVLARVPRTALGAGFQLQVAARHVQAGGVTPDVIQRVLDGDVATALADGDDQLSLVVEVLGLRRIGDGRPVQHHGLGPGGEEEGRLAVRVAAHFAGMGGVVAADAEDAADREFIPGVGRGKHGRLRLEQQAHAFSSL